MQNCQVKLRILPLTLSKLKNKLILKLNMLKINQLNLIKLFVMFKKINIETNPLTKYLFHLIKVKNLKINKVDWKKEINLQVS